MTDEIVHLPPKSIILGERFRKKLGENELIALAASIKEVGLINPIKVFQGENGPELVAGFRRLEAWQRNSPEPIPCTLCSAEDAARIEIEENIKREDFTWQERTLAIASWHERFAEGSVARTAARLSLDDSYVRKVLRVAGDFSRVSEFETFVAALNTIERRSSRKKEAEEEELIQSIIADEKEPSEDQEGVAAEAAGEQTKAPPPPSTEVLSIDFLQWASAYEGPRFNLVHFDPPYGLDMQSAGTMAATNTKDARYEDTFETFSSLLEGFLAAQERLVAENAHLMLWFSMNHYWYTFQTLRQAGWTVEPSPLIWDRGNSGIAPDPQRGFRRCYETAFFARRGDRKIVQTGANVVASPVTRDNHPSEKPERMLLGFFKRLVDETTELLDPTCGAGGALIAAKMLNAKRVLGIELDPEFYEVACERLATAGYYKRQKLAQSLQDDARGLEWLEGALAGERGEEEKQRALRGEITQGGRDRKV